MIDISVNGTVISVPNIEYRPGDGLVLHTAQGLRQETLDALADALSAALGGSAFRVYRVCCDSLPLAIEDHADGCENAPKRKAKAK